MTNDSYKEILPEGSAPVGDEPQPSGVPFPPADADDIFPEGSPLTDAALAPDSAAAVEDAGDGAPAEDTGGALVPDAAAGPDAPAGAELLMGSSGDTPAEDMAVDPSSESAAESLPAPSDDTAAEAMPEASDGENVPEPPPKRKRAVRKKAVKEDADAPSERETDALDAETDLPGTAAGTVPSAAGARSADLPILPSSVIDLDAPLQASPDDQQGAAEADDDLDPLPADSTESSEKASLLVMGLAEGEPESGVGLEGKEAAQPAAAPSLPKEGASQPQSQAALVSAKAGLRTPRPRENRPVATHTPLMALRLNELDRDLSTEERQEWNDIYASFRAKSVLTGRIIGVDSNAFYVRNKDTGVLERRRMECAVIIAYRVKIIIPETEFWMPGTERPGHVLRNMTGAEIDYTVLDVDREGGVAIASRRMAVLTQQHFFDTARGGHAVGERLTCRVLSVGPSRCLLECGGRDITLTAREMSYSSIADLRETYHPGQTLDCILTEYDRASKRMNISVRDAEPHPFLGVALRHPIGSRRFATISGKYGGGVFCTLPDGTTCLSLYTSQHTDRDFHIGDSVILFISQFDYDRCLIYGRILSKW